jgi:hypothetical protein
MLIVYNTCATQARIFFDSSRIMASLAHERPPANYHRKSEDDCQSAQHNHAVMVNAIR